MKRILFCFYPLFVNYSHGVALLSAICKESGIETDLILLGDINQFRSKLESQHYDYIGFSCVTRQDYALSIPFMQIALQAGNKVMLGGVYPSRLPPQLNNITVCTGDGELLPIFINEEIKEVLHNYVCKDMERLPLPDYELFKEIPYNRGLPKLPTTTKYLPYSSSRGCPHKCNFCAIKYQKPSYQRIRHKVEEDLTYLIDQYSPDVFAFGDSLPPYYNERWRESWGNISHPFVCYIRADIKESELIWLYDRGLEVCFFGIESGNERFRNQVLGKNLYDKDIVRTVELLKEMCVPFFASYIKGVPGETWEVMGETAKMAEDIGCHKIFYQYEDRSKL